MRSRLVRYGILAASLLALVVVPFVLWGHVIESAVVRWATEPPTVAVAAPALAALLVADVVAPIPSSVVAVAAGSWLGFGGGMLVCWVGLMGGCLLGYLLGVRAARPGSRSILGDAELARLDAAARRRGAWFLVTLRAVPVLAETSVIFAGTARMPLRRFLLVVALSNFGVAAGYAAIGAWAADIESFLLAFAGSMLLPGFAWALGRLRTLRKNARS